jgi:endonuclease/exonuclease/phosphatase (EEP) superfamily protein YafD
MLLIGFLSASLILALLTFLPLWRSETWWVRALDFPRLQFGVIASLLLVAEAFGLDFSHPGAWLTTVLCLICLVFHAWWIVPYTRIFKPEVETVRTPDRRRSIRIMTANVLMTNRNAAALIDLVRKHAPDVLVTLESDAWWQTRLDVLEPEYPCALKCPLDNLYGMHVYSRFPLTEGKIDYLVEPEVPSIHTLIHLPSGDKVRAHFLHPAPPSPTENEKSSERDAELIIVAKSVAQADLPVIVTGDLNDVAWSETTRLFRKISGLRDPRVGRGMFNTFHAGYWFVRWPLDHLFNSRHFGLFRMRRLKPFGSDHFGLMTELVLVHGGSDEPNGLEADRADRAWADTKADDQGVDASDVPRPESR